MKRVAKSATKLVVLENNDPISAETEEIQNRIRERAYELCQERGHVGREMEDWLTAESEIISVPPAELIEKDGTFQVRFAVVGIDLQDMRVMTSPNQMLVRADYRYEPEPEAGTIHLSDFKSATVFRSVQFPQPIDVNRVDIEYQDGILRVTAAKASQERMRAKRPVARKPPAKKRRAS
jgi:HSP20 family protein